MLIYINKKEYKSYSVFVFADDNFKEQKIKYALAKVNHEDLNNLKLMNQLNSGDFLPNLTIGDKINETEFYRIIVNASMGEYDLKSTDKAIAFAESYEKDELIRDLCNTGRYNFNEFGYFSVSQSVPSVKFNNAVLFSHRIGSKIYVLDTNPFRGYNYMSFLPSELKIDLKLLYELGKIEFYAGKLDSAIKYFDAVNWFFNGQSNKTYIVGHALRYKAHSYFKLHEYQRARECLLDPKCTVKSSWDYLYRSKVDSVYLREEELSVEELKSRKDDMSKYRNLVINEISARSDAFNWYNIGKANAYEFTVMRGYFTSYLFEAIWSFSILENYVKKLKTHELKNELMDFDSNLFKYYLDAYESASKLHSMLDCNVEFLITDLALEVNTAKSNSYVRVLERNLERQTLKQVRNYCIPYQEMIKYWLAKLLFILYQLDKMDFASNEDYYLYLFTTEERKDISSAIIKIYLSLSKGGDSYISFDSSYYYDKPLPFLYDNINDLFDIHYQIALVHFHNKNYQLVIDNLDKQLRNFYDDYIIYDNLDEIWELENIEHFGFDRLFYLFYYKAISEFNLNNYVKSFYDLHRAFKFQEYAFNYFEIKVDKNLLSEAVKTKKTIVKKLGRAPLDIEIANLYRKKAVKQYEELLVELSHYFEIEKYKNLHAFKIDNWAWGKSFRFNNYYKIKNILSQLAILNYNIDRHNTLTNNKHIVKMKNECLDYFYWLSDKEVKEYDENEREERDMFTSDWSIIMGSDDEASAAFWNLD